MKKTAAFILAMLLTAALALPAFAASAAPDLENGLVAHYTFDEYDPVSQTYADSSKVNPGPVEKMMGTAYTSPGPVGNAAYFDSNTVYMSDYQALGDKMLGLSAMTFSVWVYADSFPVTSEDKNRYIFTTQSWEVGDLHLNFVWGDYPGSCQVCIKGNGKAPTGGIYEEKAFTYYRTPQLDTKKWNLMTLVYDTNTNTIKFYLNGTLSETATYSATVPVNISAITVGNNYEVGKYPGFEGYLDDMRIYDRALSDAEVMALSKLGNDIVEPSPVPIADVEETKPASTQTEKTETTAEPVTSTAPEATSAPEASQPVQPDGTTAPAADSTDVPAKKGGCGSSVGAIAGVLSVLPAAFCLARRKRS